MLKKAIISLALAGSFLLLPSCASNKKTTNSPNFTPRRDYSNSSSSRTGKTQAKAVIETGKRPAWVDGNSRNFASHTYLTAIGFSKNRKQAENNARMEMSQIFNTKISGVRNSINKAHAIRQNGKVKLSESEYTAETAIKNETESIFAGLQLSRYWKDDKGTIYVLATINKTKVLPPLKEKMRKLDSIIAKLVNEAKSTDDQLVRTKKLYKALDKAVLREYYNAQVGIMSSMGQTVSTEYPSETIANMLDNQLEKLNIAVSVSGEGGAIIKYTIFQVGNDLNLKLYDNPEVKEVDFEDFGEDQNSKSANYGTNADILITGTVSFKALERGDKYKWVQGDVKLSIKNNKTGKTYNAITISEKEAKWTLEDAKRMVAKTLVKKLKKDLNKRLKKALSGL